MRRNETQILVGFLHLVSFTKEAKESNVAVYNIAFYDIALYNIDGNRRWNAWHKKNSSLEPKRHCPPQINSASDMGRAYPEEKTRESITDQSKRMGQDWSRLESFHVWSFSSTWPFCRKSFMRV
jgi:hypothetical protein